MVSVFPLKDPAKHTPIAQLLDQILHQLYPGTTEPKYYVEFWKRNEWQHILAHADMDEGWERETANSPSTPLKHPETGHVLYLDIGCKVFGPTVVWNVTKGSELPTTTSSDSSSVLATPAEMVIVPAVAGRLLRFQGHLLHAVPRPADVYWTHVHEDQDGPDYQRSVLLFNTWPIEKGMIVDYDILNATEESGDELDSSPDPISYSCEPKTSWKVANVVGWEPPTLSFWESLWTNPVGEFWIPLMGNVRRRGIQDRIAKVEGHEDIRGLLKEDHQVSSVAIQPPKTRILGVEF